MGVIHLIKWIDQNFSDCKTKVGRNSIQCDTLFIDAFQLYFKALESSDNHSIFVKKYLGSIKNVVLSHNPNQTIFIFLDGPCPAIRFQKLRERWFVKDHIDGFEINLDDIEDVNMECEEESAHEALENYIKKLINYDNVEAKSIVYSSVTTPGEAKYKFFEYFHQMKSKNDYNPSWNHLIYSKTNEMFFLALQYIDDRFFILTPYYVLYDISILRNLILYHMIIEDPFPGIHINDSIDSEAQERRKARYQSVVSKINNDLKQQIINDFIALSIIVSSENFAPFPEIERLGTTAYTFSKVLNAYKELNQPYFASQVHNNLSSKTEKNCPQFFPLIVDNCFCLESFRVIMSKFKQMYCSGQEFDSMETSENKQSPKKVNIFDFGMDYQDDLYDGEIGSTETETKQSKITKKKSKSSSKKKHRKEQNIFDIGIFDDDNDNCQNNREDEEEEENDEINNESNKECDANKNDIDAEVDNNNKNEKEEEEENINKNENYPEESQQLFRLFNFTWQLYTKSCPSWSFYYQFKESPPLDVALSLMHQEGIEVFDTEDANDMTTPLFKEFIIYPVEVLSVFPLSIYKLKIPPSPIADFWPLGAVDPKDIPIIDLKLIKKYFNEEKSKLDESMLLQNNISENKVIYKKKKKINASKFSGAYRQPPGAYTPNNNRRVRNGTNMFDIF